jgi:NADH:ubiquinone oxidoreductase subunit F (NADH-binding)/NADH:ubiquinone oxidoreductase subunit E
MLSRHGGARRLLAELRDARDARGELGADEARRAADRTGVPVAAVHGTATYYSDLRGREGKRHVRVCEGTACFVASAGGQHLPDVERALGVKVGDCSPDGEVSLQAVYCLGYCYAGPAALDGTTACAGPDLAGQLAGTVDRVRPEIPAAAIHPILLESGPEWDVWPRVLRSGGGSQVVVEVAASGLRGRGGAGFPVAEKWEAVAAAPRAPKFVVANGDEGDPGSFSDRLLMERYPAKVLEGLAMAGLACGAQHGFVYVRSEYPAAFDAMQAAAARARALGHLGPEAFDIEVVRGAGSYVAGEETSLLRSLAGLRATVRAKPPYPSTHGYLGWPTAVNNVETLASVPAIVAGGGASYARLGRAPETGTVLVCLNERFVRPGAYEVELGTPIRDIVQDLGGGLRDGRKLVVLQIGGPLGGFLSPHQLDLPLLDSALAPHSVALGHGGIVAIDDRTPGTQLVKHLWDFAAKESCGTCTPCREVTRIGAADHDAAAAYVDLMEQASLCAFGRSVPRAIRSLQRALEAT